MQINKPSGGPSGKLRHAQWGLIRFYWHVSLFSFSHTISREANNTKAEVTTSTSNHPHGPQFICQYFKGHPIAALEGHFSDYKVKYKSQLSGWRCSIDQSKCLQAVNDPRCGASHNILVLNPLNGLAVLQRVVDLLKELLFLYLHLHPESPGTSSFGDSLIKIPKREREKKKAKIRHNMSDWVSSMQRCWMEGKVGLIQGAQSSTGALDDRDYRFLLFQAPKWGVFRGPKPCSAAGILNKWKTQSLFKTVITHPVQEALVLSWTQVQHSTR